MSRAMVAALLLLGAMLAEPGAAQSPEVPHMQQPVRTFVQAEVLEIAPAAPGDPLRYDVEGWVGRDVNRLWFSADGDQSTDDSGGEAELQLLYGRLIAPYWDVLAGVRLSAGYGEGESETRAALTVGLNGLAPYWFELEPMLYLDTEGVLAAGLTASYELLFSQRLILEPRLESYLSSRAVPELGIGSGLNDLELGLRARYEIRREFAPYLGFAWEKRFGGAADLARAEGEGASDFFLVAGVRLWR